MNLLISLVPLIVAIALYAAFFKLAAFMTGRCKLSWVHSFAMASLVVVILTSGNIASKVAGNSVPAWSFPLLVVLIGLALGAWSFSTRVTDSENRPVGLTGGLKLTSLAFGLLIGLGLLLILVVQTIRSTM